MRPCAVGFAASRRFSEAKHIVFFMKAKHIVIVQFEVPVWSAWCRCNQVSHPVAASGESGREDLDDAPPKPMCTAQ
jgi:hypothetical protein